MLQRNKTGQTPKPPELRTLPLAGGGHLGFMEYGDPRGPAVVFCHGWPASCTMAELAEAAARRLGVRIISPDRPGISGSSLVAGRKLADWPPVLEQLVDHLG